jgi:uncharacterized protein (TIGR02466 family)
MIDFKKNGVLSLFPSLVFRGEVLDEKYLEFLEIEVRKLKENGQGFDHSNTIRNADHSAFQSIDSLQDIEEFADLKEVILDQTQDALDFFQVVRDDHYISNMWANITDRNHRHMAHMHPNCFLSGTFYVRTPENCGPIIFTDPRPSARVIEPDYFSTNDYNSGTCSIIPRAGEMLIWPSWLPHGVEIGESPIGEDRISIAFNIMLKGKVSSATKVMTF